MFKRLSLKIATSLSLALLVGCTSIGVNDLFFGYSQQMQASRSAQLKGEFSRAESAVITVNRQHNNYGLSLLEKARLQFLANDWLASQKNFELAYQQVQAQQLAAKVQISRGLKKASAVVSNDNAIGYEIPAYEQTMLHSYQALNYLYQGSLEGALVEVRRANLVQENAVKIHQAELDQVYDEMAEQGINSDKLHDNFPSMNELIGEVKNSYQNAYTFYLSGLLYEAGKQPNDAYIDYKRAIEIYPNNRYLQQDILRLAKQLGMHEDYALFAQRFGQYQEKVEINSGQIVVLFEQGIVNAKEQARLNLPVGDKRANFKFFTFALPIYRGSLTSTNPLSINLNNKDYHSEEIVRLQSLATKELQEQLPGLVTRQAIRLVAKEQLRRKLTKSGGDVGNILASLYNVASEKADTRSWSSLPDNVQIMKMQNIAPGEQTLTISYGGKTQDITVQVSENQTTLINFTAIGNYSGYQTTIL